MKYNNTNVRRQDRLLDESSAIQLLAEGEYGVLSIVTIENQGYGIPLSYVWNNESAIYIHCAPEGEKLQNLENNNAVSFCVVGKTKVISDKFTTAYESIVIKGIAISELDKDERMKALELILDKYSPEDKEIGMKYAEKSFARTVIVRIDIQEYSGKTKKIG